MASVPPEEATASAPLLARVRATFVAPRRLFSTFSDRPPWVDALGLATFVAAVAAAAEPAEYYLGQMENPVDRRGVPVEITSSPQQIVLWGRVMAMLSAIAGHPMLALAGGGVLLLLFGVLARGGGSFRQYLAVASHALLILSAGMLVTNVVRLALDAPTLLPNVGVLLGLPASGLAGATLQGVNLFTLWMFGVMGAGAAAIGGRVTTLSATALLWAAYLLLNVIRALVFGA